MADDEAPDVRKAEETEKAFDDRHQRTADSEARGERVERGAQVKQEAEETKERAEDVTD